MVFNCWEISFFLLGLLILTYFIENITKTFIRNKAIKHATKNYDFYGKTDEILSIRKQLIKKIKNEK